MEGLAKSKWRGEKKETSEIKNSGTHVFPLVLAWKGGYKRSGEVKGRKLQKERIQERMSFHWFWHGNVDNKEVAR